MSIIRKLAVIFLLIFLSNLFEFLQVEKYINFHADTLVALGFILLVAFSFGELMNLIGFPRISGYLVAGIIFGPYSSVIFRTDYLSIFSNSSVKDLQLLNGLAIGLIAITAGGEISLKDLKEGKKTIFLILFFKVLLITIPIIAILLIIYPYVEFLKLSNFNSILVISLFVGVLMIATSPAATIAVMNESNDRSKLSRYVLNTAVAKDILIIILLGFVLSISRSILSEGIGFNYEALIESFKELIFSLLVGIISGYILIGYLKYIKEEKLIFVLIFILILSKINETFHLSPLLVFITIGFLIKNYSNFAEELIDPIEKLSMPVYVIFFTIAGAQLNLNLLTLSYQIALVVFVIRLFGLYFSTNLATKVAGESKEIRNNLWLGFISQSGMVLGFTIFILSTIPEIYDNFFPIIVSIVGLNLLVGPVLFKLAIKNYNRSLKKESIKENKIIEQKIREEVVPYKKFNVPQFEDPKLNELILFLREKLINHLQEFESQLISKRSEESLEFYYQIVEKYIDEYQKLKNIFTSGKITGKKIKDEVLFTQQKISEWFANFCVERKSTEQQIRNAEYLLMKLFEDLKEYCETVPEYIVVEQEEDKYLDELDDNLYVKFVKSYKRLDKKLRKALHIKTPLRREIPYVTLVRYYFEYQVALEMEKVAFFIGLERLNVLRKVKKIYDDVTLNLEELLNLIAEYKDIESLSLIAIDKLNEIHERLKQEISSIGEEIESSNKDISTRLNYAFANPFNLFLKSILKAGTVELNIRQFKFSKIYADTNRVKEITLETIRFWVNYLIGFLGIGERDARTFEITSKINSIIDDTMISHYDTINDKIKNLIGEVNSLLRKFEKEISNKELLKFENLIKIKNIVSNYRDEIILTLNENGIGKLTFLRKTFNVSNTINSFKDKFNNVIKTYEKEIKVLTEEDFDLKGTRTHYIELKTLHFIDIIKSFFENEIIQEIIKLNEIINGHLSSAIIEIKNIENVIHYHFNIAIDELFKIERNNISEISINEIEKIINDIIKSSTQLVREKIKIWGRQIEKLDREVEVSLTEKIYNQINQLKEVFKKESLSTLEKRIQKSRISSIIEKSNLELSKRYQRIKGFFLITKRKFYQLLRYWIGEVKEFLEIDTEGRSISIQLYDQTVYDDIVYNSLPFVYKKLFDYSTSDIIEILVGREKEKQLLIKAYERTLKGLPGSTAIIGESGTGKSSLISTFLTNVPADLKVINYKFEKTINNEKELLEILNEILGTKFVTTFDELIGELYLDSEYKIIVLEDVHKLFLRKIGGLEAIKKLLLIISETNSKIFWIVSISYHAWQLLNKILNIDYYFPFQIKTEILTKEQIKDAILKRHKASGFDLEFLPEEDIEIHKHWKRSFLASDKQAALEEEFFDRLYEACEGNITSALFFWIKSIRDFKYNKIFIKPFKSPDFRSIERFDIEKLLTLSNLIQHGSLTIKEHQEIFKIDEMKSKSILNFLCSTNLVHHDMNEKGEKVFYINPAVYKPIEKELRKLNIFD